MSSGKIVAFAFIAIIASASQAEIQVCKAPDGQKTITNEGCKAPDVETDFELTEIDTSKSRPDRRALKLTLEKEELAKSRAIEMKRITEKAK